MRRYVVRGKGENGLAATAAPDPAEDDRIDGHLPATDGRFATFATIDDAEQARRDLVGWGCTEVRIYDADTGAVVPTYAEALARLEQVDAARHPVVSGEAVGYVVRGTWGTTPAWAEGPRGITCGDGPAPHVFTKIRDALAAGTRMARVGGLTDVRYFAVDAAGVETPLLSAAEKRLAEMEAAPPAMASWEQIGAAIAGAFAIVPCNNNQPRVFIAGAGVELVRHRRALADMRLPDNVADAEDILASATAALRAALTAEPSHPSRMTGDLQTYPQGAALHVVPELADEVDEHRATKEKLAEADRYIATQEEQIEALETALAARAPLTDAQVEGFAQAAMDDICKGTERPRNAVARAIRAALNAAGPEVPTPDPAPRAESGPMRFGDDWAGVFLRGDYAGPMAMYLGQALDMLGASDPIFVAQLRGLASTLSGCDERGTLDGLQQMRPFAECVAPGAAVRILSTAEIFAPMSPEDSVAADVAEMIHEESDAWPARGDHERLAAAHGRIAAMPKEKQHEAMRRASRSYSAPWTCMEYDGCRRDGNDIVWPDGERWPTRTGR